MSKEKKLTNIDDSMEQNFQRWIDEHVVEKNFQKQNGRYFKVPFLAVG